MNFAHELASELLLCVGSPGGRIGSPGPGGQFAFHLAGRWGKQGIGAVISLTEHPLDHSLLSEFGMDYLHLPIEDFTAPTLEQMQSAIEFIRQQEAKGHAVLVHCQAGIGRTGTILAAWMATQYMDAQQAIDHVRQLRPGSLEVPCQEQAIYEFVTHLKDRKSY